MAEDLIRERVIHAVLERQRVKYGNRTFLYFKNKEFSYNDFSHAADQVARGLQKMGITKWPF
jgi:non-ribosomal peptide synthetase component E (peptide arylation enzyme)